VTLVEKILAAHSDKDRVSPGEFINARVDVVLANDITAPIAIKEFRKIGVDKVFDPSKIVMVADHFVPNKDILSAEQAKFMRDFCIEQGIKCYDVGEMGIEHVLLPEQGIVLPGDVIIGADSHTCTYGAVGAFSTGMGSTDIASAMATGYIWMKVPQTIKFVYNGTLRKWVGGKDLILHTIGDIGVDGALYSAMEFTGKAISSLPMDGRFTMANMAIEAGAKAGIFHVDGKTEKVIEYDVSSLEPQVSLPHLPSNAKPVSQVRGITIDQAVIGSCTNGRLEDLRLAVEVLKDRHVHPNVRCIVIPGTQQVYLDALKEGIIEKFINAGAAVSTPTCGPCLGGHMGVLAEGERCISTTNRNFVGRMGHTKSEVYLANPAVAMASAIAGEITGPDNV